MFSTFWLLKVCLDGVLISKYFVGIFSERRARAWGPHGEWKTEKDPQAEDDLFQLPARCSAEALPEGAVPRSARESRAGGSARPHSDTGKLPETVYHVGFSNWSILLEARESGLWPTICSVTMRRCVITQSRRWISVSLSLTHLEYILTYLDLDQLNALFSLS